MKVTLYSTNCPQCKALEAMLKKKNIEPEIIVGSENIMRMGYRTAPILKVDNIVMTYPYAVQWIKGYSEEEPGCDSCSVENGGESNVV